jgi:protein-S-isoprenylcysteine O-methyltransferase Ste14
MPLRSILHARDIEVDMMSEDSMKKAGVVAVVAFVLLYCISVPVMWFVLDVPIWLCAIVGVMLFGVVAVVIYHAKERMREIEEGLEDAVNHY